MCMCARVNLHECMHAHFFSHYLLFQNYYFYDCCFENNRCKCLYVRFCQTMLATLATFTAGTGLHLDLAQVLYICDLSSSFVLIAV
jgi:hypothetical protein